MRPTGAEPARIHVHLFRSHFPACASGYPGDWNEKARWPILDAGTCKVLEKDGYVWLVRADDGTRLAAVREKTSSAGRIRGGFSGGPLKKGEYLVGLMASGRPEPRDATAYAIPAVYFPDYVLKTAQTLSDAMIPLADSELRREAVVHTLRSANPEITSANAQAEETGRNGAVAAAQDGLSEELISSYSTIFVGRRAEADKIRTLMCSEQFGYLFGKGSGAGRVLCSFISSRN